VNIKKFVGKNDLILILVIFIVALIMLFFISFSSKNGEIVVITVDGNVYATYDLSIDEKVVIKTDEGSNVLIIKDNKCYLEEADCPDKLCVKQGEIYKSGQSIICLPHRVVISVESKEETEYDAIAQ